MQITDCLFYLFSDHNVFYSAFLSISFKYISLLMLYMNFIYMR